MMKERVFYLLVLLIVASQAVAQKKLKKASMYYEDYNFKKAIEYIESHLKKGDSLSDEFTLKLANSYFNLSDYGQSKKWYERIYEKNKNNIEESIFIKYIQSLKATDNNFVANYLINDYYKAHPKRLKLINKQKKYLDSIGLNTNEYNVLNLENNSEYSEFGPMFYDGMLVFASSRKFGDNENIYNWNNQAYLDIYIARTSLSSGEIFNIRKFYADMSSSYHQATIAFTPDERSVFFTSNFTEKNKLKTNREGVSNMQILKGDIVNEELVNVTSLDFNNINYSCAHPAVSTDGSYLYFVSDMPGGYGSSDIYKAKINEDGSIGTPVNLGETINTPGREVFPFVLNNTLYFASDTHFGFGGLDIFYSNYKNSSYSLPINMGRPINSNRDDFSLIYDEATKSGYFASNRIGGKGDDDLYFFRQQLVKELKFSGLVLEDNVANPNPIPHAVVKIYDSNNKFINEIISDETGFYEANLPFNEQFTLTFTKARHNQKSLKVNTKDPLLRAENNNVYLLSLDNLVEKEDGVEKIRVNPIYFETWKHNITAQAEIELKKVIFALKQFPDIKIKIESHTDSRGTDALNLKLSNNRAKATYEYLIANGVNAQRIISYKGYGETRLKNYCANGVECSDKEHEINRRSDFIVVKE